jgi:hypothetical protein
MEVCIFTEVYLNPPPDNERTAIDRDLKKRKRRPGCFQESGPNTWTMMSENLFNPVRYDVVLL